MNYQDVLEKIVENALAEDAYKEDLTSNAIIDKKETVSCSIITRTPGVSSGIEIACMVYNYINPRIKLKVLKQSGSYLNKGDVLIAVEGPVRDILRGQRVVENFLQRLCSIATITNKYVQEIKGTKCKIIDSRNNTPNLRLLEKRAVIDGGGLNDVFNLKERLIITRNHLMINHNIEELVNKLIPVKEKNNLLIQVEVDTIEDFLKAINTKCDLIVLNDFKVEEIKQFVAINNKSKILISKGNYSLSTVHDIAKAGVDYISLESITSNIKPLDISVRFYLR